VHDETWEKDQKEGNVILEMPPDRSERENLPSAERSPPVPFFAFSHTLTLAVSLSAGQRFSWPQRHFRFGMISWTNVARRSQVICGESFRVRYVLMHLHGFFTARMPAFTK
jgi:hypothetical protein